MKLLFRTLILGVGGIVFWTGLARSGPSIGDGLQGLDSSFTAGYAPKNTLHEFHHDADALEMSVASAETAPTGVEPADERTPAKASDFKFHSAFSHAVLYDSNIAKTSLDPKGELIESPTVSIGVTRGREGLSREFFENTYSFSYLDYAENDKLDYPGHLNYTRYQWRGKKFGLDVQNYFRPLSPRETGDRRELIGPAGGSTVIATSNEFIFKTAYEITPKLRFLNTWKHEIYDFPANARSNTRAQELLGYQIHTFAPRLQFEVSAKSNFYTEYQFQTADYFRGGLFAFKTHAVKAGFLTQFNPKTSFMFEAGYKLRDFNQPLMMDEDLFAYRTAVERKLTEKLALTVYGARDLALDVDTAGGTVYTHPLNKDQTSAGLALEWEISPKMTLSADMGVQFGRKDADYTLIDPETGRSVTRSREDVIYNWGVQWRWMRTKTDEYLIGYRFTDKDSSLKNYEYEDHQILAAVNLNL